MNPDSDWIPDIHRYCDGWCERCRFTRRCGRYAMAPDLRPDDGPSESPSFFRHMADTLSDPGLFPADPADAQAVWIESDLPEEDMHPAVEGHSLVLAANRYATLVEGWFADSETLFRAKGRELDRRLTANLPGHSPVEEARLLVAAAEVIRWDQYLIGLKLADALLEQLEPDLPPALLDPEAPGDGHAKVALLSMDRSLDGWGLLLRLFPEREDESLTVLAHLTRLRRLAEEAFPQARHFHRPGFDD